MPKPWPSFCMAALMLALSGCADRASSCVGYDATSRDYSFGPQTAVGLLEHDPVTEASGLAASRRNRGVLWTHNDSGARDQLYALSTDGRHLGAYHATGAGWRDWEDMALGPGPSPGVDYLYVGDIGDNFASQELKRVYRVPEPQVDTTQTPVTVYLGGVETIIFRYPDGPRNAETLMIDNRTGDIYVVTKGAEADVYCLPYPQSTVDTVAAERVGTLPIASVTAGDISACGSEILLKTYTSIYYWPRGREESIWEALTRNRRSVPYWPEPQGEALAWAVDGSGFYTLSEERQLVAARLYFFSRFIAEPEP